MEEWSVGWLASLTDRYYKSYFIFSGHKNGWWGFEDITGMPYAPGYLRSENIMGIIGQPIRQMLWAY
jgi:hypothetical protein